MGGIDHARDPWYNLTARAQLDWAGSPWRILEDAGGAFSMGAIGGTLWHSIKGYKNSPKVRRSAAAAGL